MKQIAIFFVVYVVRAAMKDRVKVTFDTKQVTSTNILKGTHIYPIVLAYQGL